MRTHQRIWIKRTPGGCNICSEERNNKETGNRASCESRSQLPDRLEQEEYPYHDHNWSGAQFYARGAEGQNKRQDVCIPFWLRDPRHLRANLQEHEPADE